MRLAEMFHMPVCILEQVLQAWELSMWSEKLSKEPTALERIEVAIAYLCQIQWNTKKGKNKPAKKITDFLLFANAWEEKVVRYVDDDDVNHDINMIIDAFGRDRLVINRSNQDGSPNRQG